MDALDVNTQILYSGTIGPVLPNAIIGEYFPHYAPFFAELGELHIDITSSIAMIGDAPGLGVRMYEDALASHEY